LKIEDMVAPITGGGRQTVGAMDRETSGQMFRVNLLTLVRRILFGQRSARSIGDEAKALGAKRVLLVTDMGVVKSGVLAEVIEGLQGRNMEVQLFSDVEPEPDIETADQVTRTVRGGDFDLVCGVGGGSAMDIAKIASVMATNPGETRQYAGVGLLKKPGLPKVLVPTTAGTGSEMTANALIGLHEEGTKVGVISPYVLADIAVVDPMLALTLPAKPTASSGLDALTHAIESYISLDANPITSLLSLQAMELITHNLPTATFEGGNLQARSAMSLSAMMAGISIANAGTCSGHAAAYGYATKYRIPHGISVAVALPYVLEFNLTTCPEKGRAIAEAMGVTTSGLSSAETATNVAQAVLSLMKKVQCPVSLVQLGVPKTEITNIARNMLKMTRLMVHNPRPMNESKAVNVITKMWEGSIGRG